MELLFRPLPVEPAWKPLGKGCLKKATHTRALTLLRYELGRIGATDVIIEAGFVTSQIRNDGYPYSSATPSHSTIRLSFLKGGKMPLSFTCGGHRDWVVNLYLIALTLERLRAIDRYACTQGDEQYKGFGALPPGTGKGEWHSPRDAVAFLARTAGWMEPPGVPANIRELYQAAARKAHPDAGGSTDLMSRVNKARDYIEDTRTGGGA